MKTFLLTIPDLDELISNKKESELMNSCVRLYYAKDEIMLVETAAKIADLEVTFVPAESYAEIVFDVGLIIGAMKEPGKDIEIFCGDRIDIPESLVKSLNIKKMKDIKPKRQVRQSKKKDDAGNLAKPVKSETISTSDASKPAPKRTARTKFEPKVESKPEEKVVEKPKRARKAKVEENTEANAEVKVEIAKTEPVAKTPVAKKSEAKAVASDNTTTFLKQMCVRSSDLKASYSDDSLLLELVSIFKNDNSTVPAELLKMLNDTFDEDDANIVYKWVKPNAKRLHELALTI